MSQAPREIEAIEVKVPGCHEFWCKCGRRLPVDDVGGTVRVQCPRCKHWSRIKTK